MCLGLYFYHLFFLCFRLSILYPCYIIPQVTFRFLMACITSGITRQAPIFGLQNVVHRLRDQRGQSQVSLVFLQKREISVRPKMLCSLTQTCFLFHGEGHLCRRRSPQARKLLAGVTRQHSHHIRFHTQLKVDKIIKILHIRVRPSFPHCW